MHNFEIVSWVWMIETVFSEDCCL